jgi:hypothetical protein
MRARSSTVALGFLAAAFPALAAQPGSLRPKTYGTQDQIVLTLGPCDAVNQGAPSAPFLLTSCGFLTADTGPVEGTALAGFPLHLPQGALIDEVDVNYFDTIDAAEPQLKLLQVSPGVAGFVLDATFPEWNQGDNSATFLIEPPHEVNNEGYSYAVTFEADRDSVSNYQGLYNIIIRYRLQVSPPPETATFGDVPTEHPFFQFVEALASSGITAGCGNGNFCPDQPLTRGQMAVFLSKALGLHFASPD